ncbi:tubulin binding cofactor C-domain-containing protein [Mycena albidolilacea]|uniref:Tubulin binding cofactor C-domain-containing protein n=1 Tax=Mycena albidolilacea TaxID=1033008 RepID=A0AAD7ELG6_9AGAR|nr:tubulin binding cofactor C-domain-containing protein [Mycena albidolilacea]
MSDPAWSFSQTFTAQFQASRTELESRVDLAKSSKITADALQTLSSDLAKLTKTLSDATGSLPSYDQRQYELQLKGLQKSLEELRTLIPKSKFAFKRKDPVPSTVASPSSVQPIVLETSQPGSTPTSTNLTLSSRSLQYLTMTSFPDTSEMSDLTISDLNNCIVNLLPDASGGHSSRDSSLKISALHIRNLTDTVLLLPIIQGSVLLHDLSRCVVVVGCHQFRMHNSTSVDVYLSISSTPIIEHCSQIRFASYPASLGISEDSSPNVLSIQDFSHIKSTPSPNWSMLPSETQISKWPIGSAPEKEEVAGLLSVLLPGS